jgi:hypothetical protein
MDSFIEILEILSILKPLAKNFIKNFDNKHFFNSGNLAIENLIGILKIQEIPRLGNSLTGPKNNQKQVLVKTCQIRQKTMKF